MSFGKEETSSQFLLKKASNRKFAYVSDEESLKK